MYDPFDPTKSTIDNMQRVQMESIQRENDYLRMIVRTTHHSVDFKSKTWHALIDCMAMLVQCKHPNELLTHPNEQIRTLTKCLLEKDA